MSWLMLAWACAAEPPETPTLTDPIEKPSAPRHVLKETVVNALPAGDLPMASMLLESDYELPDGSTTRGPTGFVKAKPSKRVGEGSEFVFMEQTFRVVEVQKVKGERGRMVIEQVIDSK